MANSCWECLFGNGTPAEEPYSVQLNGNVSRAPPWPAPQLKNEKMFLLPKQLEVEDSITINCETSNDPGLLRIALVTGFNSPDYRNLACQLEMNFPPQYSDKVELTVVQDGVPNVVHNDLATNYYSDNNFSMKFVMREPRLMEVRIGESHFHYVELVHDIQNIRFLTINGDINKVLGLDFQFG